MIESPIIKKYIAQYFLENSTKSLVEIVRGLVGIFKSEFIPNEIVFVKSREGPGKILSATNSKYTINLLVNNEIMETSVDNIFRKDQLTKNELLRHIEGITRISPFGRVLRDNILNEITTDKSKVSGENEKIKIKRAESFKHKAMLEKQKAEETVKVAEKVAKKEKTKGSREIIQEKKLENALEALKLLKCEEIKIEGLGNMENHRLLIECYMFYNYFRKYFNFEFTIDELTKAIISKTYNSEPVIKMHAKLIKMLSDESELVGKFQFKQIFENALDICVPDNCKLSDLSFSQVDWVNQEINAENWRSIMKNFFGYIYNAYDFKKVSFFREFTQKSDKDYITDRLNIIKFLIECCYSTSKFKQAINLGMEDSRSHEKTRMELNAKIKKAKNDLVQGFGGTKAEIEVLENELKMNEHEILSSGFRADIAFVDDVLFFYMLNEICFCSDGKFFKMSPEQVKSFLKSYEPQNKTHSTLVGVLRSYTSIFSKV